MAKVNPKKLNKIKKQKKRLPKYKKNRLKMESALSGRDRFDIVNVIRARMAAKARTTNLMKTGFKKTLDPEKARNLKKSVVGMAEFADPPDEIFDKIIKMDADKLARLFEGNQILMDIYFRYPAESFNPELTAYIGFEDEKEADIKLLVEQYERAFGVIE